MNKVATRPSHQGILEEIICVLFPGYNILINIQNKKCFDFVLYILTNARKDILLVNPSTSSPLQVDVWIPDLKLCFEFQVIIILA